MKSDTTATIWDPIWRNNPALTQFLGLCPMLAVTQTLAQALGLGLATLGVIIGACLSVSAIRYLIPANVRLPAFVIIIAGFVICAMLIMQAFAFNLYQSMALFVQIIVTNCLILGRVELFASKNPLWPTFLDSLMTGLGFILALLLLGALRELIGQGTLGDGLHLLLGPVANDWHIRLPYDYQGFLLFTLPPGAFIGMGLLLALKNKLGSQTHKSATNSHEPRKA